MYAIILGFITAFGLTFSIIPVIIRVTKERRLFDRPNERSAHEEPTPSLGGIAIFAGSICGVVLWTPLYAFGNLQYILAAFVLIFLVGVVDDLMPISPTRKFASQLLVAIILAYKANIRITSFYGMLGIQELPEITGFILSIVIIIGIINAFNLIDGINGLAGSIGLLACLVWGAWYYGAGYAGFAVMAFSLAGAIVAFLKFNFTPAKIFMGDTGSLLIGTVCAILAIQFVESSFHIHQPSPLAFASAPAIAISVLIIPLFDTVRVFVRRLAQGRSPFHPDKSHIHHLLLDTGMSHMQATGVLILVNILFVGIVVWQHRLGNMALVLAQIIAATLLVLLAAYFSEKYKRRNSPD
jgi:UDP-GlcNAc:undecaprenyl-phosphate/decaprenyl-phosphate GlcNAc-1-phosphate transferase